LKLYFSVTEGTSDLAELLWSWEVTKRSEPVALEGIRKDTEIYISTGQYLPIIK
jgi:hypothetical protein